MTFELESSSQVATLGVAHSGLGVSDLLDPTVGALQVWDPSVSMIIFQIYIWFRTDSAQKCWPGRAKG